MPKEVSSRDRLIDVATSLFAKDGFQSTSLRAIAKQAGVSPALLVHHFDTRDNLIRICIEQTLGQWMDVEGNMMSKPLAEALAQWQQTMDEHGQKLEFFRQVLLAGGDIANLLLVRAVDEAEQLLISQIASGHMRETENPRDIAILMTMHGLGPLILREQVSFVMGGDFLTGDNAMRLAKANESIYKHGIYTQKIRKDGEK